MKTGNLNRLLGVVNITIAPLLANNSHKYETLISEIVWGTGSSLYHQLDVLP